MRERTTFERYIIDGLVDRLDECEGMTAYGADLGFELTLDINENGELPDYDGMGFIHDFWDEAAKYWEYEKFAFGEHFHNPFEDPDGYAVCMVIEYSRSAMAGCALVDEHWNDEMELTADVVETLKEQLQTARVEL